MKNKSESFESNQQNLENVDTKKDTHVKAHAGERIIIEMEDPQEKEEAVESLKEDTLEAYGTHSPIKDTVEHIKFSRNNQVEKVEDFKPVSYNESEKIITPTTPAKDEVISRAFKLGNSPVDTFTPSKEYNRIPTGGLKRKFLTFLAAVGLMSGTALATEGGKNEPGKGNTIENRDLSKATKTTVEPTEAEGFRKLGVKDGKKYFIQEVGASKKAEGTIKLDEAKAISFIKQELGRGVSPKQLIQEKHGSAEVINELAKTFYKEKIVYTEPETAEKKEVKEVDGPKFAKMSSRYYGPNKHALADIWTEVRDSKDKSDGGMVDTGEELRKIQLIDEMGNNDGAPFVLAKGELQKLTGGDEAFDISAEELRAIRDTALNKTKNTAYSLTGEEIAQGGINK